MLTMNQIKDYLNQGKNINPLSAVLEHHYSLHKQLSELHNNASDLLMFVCVCNLQTL